MYLGVVVCGRKTYIGSETDRKTQLVRQIYSQTDRLTGQQTNRRKDGQTDKQPNRQTDRQTN